MLRTRVSNVKDLPFVFDSWMKSWRQSKWAGVIPNNMYYDVTRTAIEDLLARGAKITIAHPPEHPDLIVGWACAEEKDGLAVLHYLYIKDPYLGPSFGVLDTLLGAIPGAKPGYITFNQQRKQFREWKHVPEMARRLSL